MSDLLAGVILLPTDGAPAGPPVDIALQERPYRLDLARGQASRRAGCSRCRRWSTPMITAVRCRTSSIGAGGKPLKFLAAPPGAVPISALDPYLAAVVALSSAARSAASGPS